MIDIFDLLKNAFNIAKGMDDSGDSDREMHRIRSQNLVDELARGFQRHYEDNPMVRVFWARNNKNQSSFNLKELLYDITVCEVDETPSATGRALMSFVTKTHWIIESEFERNSRAAIVDMSKLVLGQSENVLFIGPSVGPKEGYMDMLGNVARRCIGRVYLAIIEHPSRWKTHLSSPELYLWDGDAWSQEKFSTS